MTCQSWLPRITNGKPMMTMIPFQVHLNTMNGYVGSGNPRRTPMGLFATVLRELKDGHAQITTIGNVSSRVTLCIYSCFFSVAWMSCSCFLTSSE
mmetsp:Transcript_1939/g.3140  ORF Transcript_1939/g.3140 Transcript_1939/m.3140 type:complete len:95 (+) Transcript_1939:481-765(+)